MDPTPNDRVESTELSQDLSALKNLIEQIDMLLDVPDGKGMAACREASKAALALVTHLSETPAAAQLGSRGGRRTAERGPEYFAKIAGMRKTRAGGRPKKAV